MTARSDLPGALALDVGGTKLAAALVAHDGVIIGARSVPTPRGTQPDEVWTAAERLLDQVVDEMLEEWDERAGGDAPLPWPAIAGLGIGSAGPIDRSAGTVSPINIGAWRNFDICARAREWLVRRSSHVATDVYLVGDGAAAALGELAFGAARGVRNAMVIVVSTGIGGGIIVDGVVRTGRTGSAGHIGHITYQPGGRECACGHRGCVEAYASGPSMVRCAIELGWSPAGGRPPDGRALLDAYHDGDGAAVAAVEAGMAALGQAIADASALLELDAVFLGGGVMAAADVLLPLVHNAVGDSTGLAYVPRTRIDTAELGSAAGLAGAGAAALYPQQLSSGE